MGWHISSLWRRDVVDFYGDFIDPFGFIGFHNLRQAAEENGTAIRWRGFELEPETPSQGEPFQTAGNSDLRRGMWASVTDFARKAGLTLEDPGFVPRSRLAHGLILHWPGKATAKNPLIEAIYQAYFSDKKNIGEASVLVEIAGRFGVAEKRCNDVLNKAALSELEEHRAKAMHYRFPGMPAYRFRKQTMFGALSTEAWRRVLKQ